MAAIKKQKGPAKSKTRACRPKTESAKLAIAKGGSGKISEAPLAKYNYPKLEELREEIDKTVAEFTQLVQKIGLKADIILDVAVHIQPRDKNTD